MFSLCFALGYIDLRSQTILNHVHGIQTINETITEISNKIKKL